MKKTLSYGTLLVSLFASGALTASAATFAVSAITPITATVDVAQTYTATYESLYTVSSCTLYADGDSEGSMSLSGSLVGTATKSLTLTTSGSHTLYASCVDTVGNVITGGSTSISVSASTDISSPSKPTNLQISSDVGDSTPSFTWSASSDNTAVSSYDIQIDGSAYAPIGNVTSYTASAMANGSHTFAVRARDAAGNTSSSASLSFTVSASGGSSSGSGTVSLTPPFGLTQMATDAMLIVSANRSDLELSTGRACEWASSSATTKVSAVFGAIADASVKAAIENFASCGTVSTHHLGAGERLGAVNSYKAAFGRLPSTSAHWDDAIEIGNGRFTTETSASAEAAAMVTFKKIYLRDANTSNERDRNAVYVMAYGLRPQPRSLSAEAAATVTFRAVYGRGPSSAQDWDAVRATAYSGATR